MVIISWNFFYCTEQFYKSDTTSFIKTNYEPFYLFNNGTYYEQMELSLLILVCIHKLYIVYLEIYVVPIGLGFLFFWSWKSHGKSM